MTGPDRPLDPRIERGLRAQLDVLRARETAGDGRIGWKAAFRTRAAMDLVAIDRPLIGFMTESGQLPSGAVVSLDGWDAPEFDVEIAVRLARDIAPGADQETVRDALGPLAAAIELNDYAPPPVDVEAVLFTNVFHRNVLLGPLDESRRSVPGFSARILLNGAEVRWLEDGGELPGELVDIVTEMSELLAACGATLRAGDLLITGGLVAPVQVARGDHVRVQIEPLGELEVSFV